ncbi:MAG TPA: hypothetical protein VIC62_22325 [Nakamurella sp.]
MADDPLASAIDQLYGADPDAFMARRTDLVTQAKAAGAVAVAKQIGALRKPTRSAYAINRLARTDPDAVDRLRELGDQWRDAERSVDAEQIRSLTKARRRLLDELTRAAFAAAEETNPSSAVRDEVVSTLTAALSDESVADEIRRGVLVKPARWEGFGFGGPELTLVPSPGSDTPAKPKPRAPSSTGASAPRLSPAERREAREAEQRAAAERQAQAEKEAAAAREAALADARQAVDEAEESLILATDEEQAKVDRVHDLEQELTDARRAVDEARRDVRRAEIAQRRAQDTLKRLEPGRT